MSYSFQITEYFLNKNLDVSFNTLGANDTLTNLFIKENQDVVSDVAQSNHIKHLCYNRYYKIEPRTKFTGFESYQKLDNELRFKMSQHVTGLLGIFEEKSKNTIHVFGSYLTELKESFKKFNNPLLYLSGGIDSEFVALAMLDAGIKFTPVIFQWVDDNDKIHNIHDITYATDFCFTHKLIPIIRKVNLEKLWTNPEFELLSKETNVSSPQINTYVYMIESMAVEYPNSTHVLGGEVRFKTQYNVVENKFNNFVLASKVASGSLGYSGISYFNTQNVNYTNANTGNMVIKLTYNWDGNVNNNQSWQITATINNGITNTPTGGPLSGNWFNSQVTSGGTGFDYSIDNGSTWNTLNVGATDILTNTTTATGDTSAYDASGVITIKIRSKSDTNAVVTSSINLVNVYNYTPTSVTFAVGGVTSWMRPNSLVNTVSVFVSGGGGGGGSASRAGNGGGENWAAVGGGGGGGSCMKIENIILGNTEPTPQLSFTVGAGGAGGNGLAHTNGGNGGNTTVTVKSSSGDINLVGYGGYGGQKNSTLDPQYGQFGAGGNAGLIYTGDPGGNNGNTIDEAYGGGGGGSGGNAVGVTGGVALDLTPFNKGSFYAYFGTGLGGNGGVTSASSFSGNGNSAGAESGGGGEGAGILVVNLAPTSYASGGDGGSGCVKIIF